ncbi:hypothetical protein B0H19DRAFT_1260862 [Mycena capillaripes]|nr:hypothetical protein B0H19DRAFT_1260862 [Mycena capillaripes]
MSLNSSGEEVFLDFEVLFERLRNATDPHGRGPQPLLDGLYSAYVDFFEAVDEAANAYYNYLVCCSRVLDSTRTNTRAVDDSNSETALTKVDEKHGKLCASIAEVAERWGETTDKKKDRLWKSLTNGLPGDWMISAESFIFPWLLDSKRHALCVDLPNWWKLLNGIWTTFDIWPNPFGVS